MARLDDKIARITGEDEQLMEMLQTRVDQLNKMQTMIREEQQKLQALNQEKTVDPMSTMRESEAMKRENETLTMKITRKELDVKTNESKLQNLQQAIKHHGDTEKENRKEMADV